MREVRPSPPRRVPAANHPRGALRRHPDGNQKQARPLTGDIPIRIADLRAVIDRFGADDHQIRIFERKDVLQQGVLANGGPRPVARRFARKWRPGQDETANTYVVEVACEWRATGFRRDSASISRIGAVGDLEFC